MDQTFEQLIQSDKPVLVDFYATWCGPCQMLGPILSEVKDTLGERVTIIKVDVDNESQAAAHYRVRSVPTMILFQAGRLIWRQSGVLSKQEIVNSILQNSTWPELPGQETP